MRAVVYRSLALGVSLAILSLAALAQAPVQMASNYSTAAPSSYGWAAGYTFNQRFTVKTSGVPSELGVHMGNNQNPYSVRVVLNVLWR